MDEDLDLYTGTLIYREIEFTFSFDEKELRLIPPADKRHVVEWDWKMKEIASGAFVFDDPIPIEEPFLVGECNETKMKIIFIPKQGSTLHLYNSVIRIELRAYVICRLERDMIDRAAFTCPEINYIHPVNQAFSLTIDPQEYMQKGIVTLNTQDFNATTTEKQTFEVDGRRITAYFSISRTVSTKINQPPLTLESALIFEFDPTNDYRFILRLWSIAREFIRFLCYRKNVFIPSIELSTPYKDGKHESFATMIILDQDKDSETTTLQKGRFIKQIHISGHEGQILSDIASNAIYMRHLPDTYSTGRHLDAARFVMITAAFEWEFHRLYPDGVRKSSATIEAEERVSETIQEHLEKSSGKQKKIFKFLKRLVKSDSLQSEIIQMGKDFSGILNPFGNRLYGLNDQKLVYSEMGQRLSDQRNHFAHGDLDKEFIGLSLLDLVYLEYVIYAIQLRYYGIEDIEIQRAINELFHLSFAL